MADQSPPPPNTWCHVEIHSANPEQCKKFYGDVFGWDFQDVPEMKYSFYNTGTIGGGVAEKGEQSPNQLVNYVNVESIEDTCQKIESSGGAITMPKTAVADAGWMAMATDPDGNLFGLWKSAGQ
ncbi:MAG: VOC family protein [Planctomycetota bacterium]